MAAAKRIIPRTTDFVAVLFTVVNSPLKEI